LLLKSNLSVQQTRHSTKSHTLGVTKIITPIAINTITLCFCCLSDLDVPQTRLHESFCVAAALGVTKFMIAIVM
jgi:hypothetical protein